MRASVHDGAMSAIHPSPDGAAVASGPAAALPAIVLVGAGRVAQALAIALAQQGVAVTAIGSRRAALGPGWPEGCPQPSSPQDAVDRAGLVLMTVPDDHIAACTEALRWRPDQAVVHCSGATDVAALASAAQAGAAIGGFHPLQIFSDPPRAAQRLAGSTVAIEAAVGSRLSQTLRTLAQVLGLRPIVLPPGMRARYHVAAGYAASFLLPVLAEAVSLWKTFGVDEREALAALLPLARGTLEAVEGRGLAGAVSGPIARGDVGVVGVHLAALAAVSPAAAEFYRALAQPQVALAQEAGRIDVQAAERLRAGLMPD
jgi:predicted short-subunit dehydrogenase-like oxidoreductase (DUF2520 family)